MTRIGPAPALLLALVSTSCVLDTDLGDTPVPTSGSTTTPSTSEPDEPDTTDPTVTTGVTEPLCPNSPNFTCTVPFGCADWPCGGLQDLYDADGCPRLDCGPDEPCPAGQVCYDTGDWGGCNADVAFCEDDGDECSCQQSIDCHATRYCVPEEIGPPADCFAITDADACLAAGCSAPSTVIPMTLDGDTCVCGEPEPVCLWFEEADWSSPASPGAFYRNATDEVASFPNAWVHPPHGWAACADDPTPPPACACVGTCGGG